MKVSVDGVSKRYGSFAALDDVSLEVLPGQIVALLGLNGAGKTTLLRCLATVCGPSLGSIRLDGELLRRSRLDLRKRLFFLPDVPLIHANPVRHIGMVARLYDREDSLTPERVFRLLEELDLLGCAQAPAAHLSRGEAYKAGLAALLAVDPDLLLLDEPFASGMDPHGIAVLRRHAREAAGRGAVILYSTQILEIAESFSDRVAILHRGRLRTFDSLRAVRESLGTAADGILASVIDGLRSGA